MSPQTLAFLATVVLLLPIGYLFLASPAFLLVRLSNPTVTMLLRGMFKGYFWMLMIIAPLVTVAYAYAGRPVHALGAACVAAFAILTHRWFLRHIDMDLARIAQAADTSVSSGAVRHLRGLHVGGMAANWVLFAGVIGGIQLLV
jgi:hypothetical protein